MQNLREKEKLHNKSALWFGFKPPKVSRHRYIAHMRRLHRSVMNRVTGPRMFCMFSICSKFYIVFGFVLRTP